MADLVLVQMLDGTDHLLHHHDCIFFTKPLLLDDAFKELAARSQLHDDMNVAGINVAFMELDDVWVVDLLQNRQLLLQQLHILLNVLLKNALDGVLDVGIREPVGQADCSEVSTSYELFELKDLANVEVRKSIPNILKNIAFW